jgi:hypothetical protein
MNPVPSSMVAAVACSAGAGKNPWLPLALIFLLAAPATMPAILIEPILHRQLHAIGPEALLWSLGGVFLVLAIADSFADKISVIERWLVPISTAWRPFAGVAAAAIIGYAALREPVEHEIAPRLARADIGIFVGGSLIVLTIALAALATWIATMGKTGARLLMSIVPIPGLKLVHSFVDDLFALAASIAGLAFGNAPLVVTVIAAYLIVGIFTGPILTRLTWIHVRIGISLLRKGWRTLEPARSETPPPHSNPGGSEQRDPPRWVSRWLREEGIDDARTLPAYVYRAPTIGRCRAGTLIVARGRVVFLTRVFFRPRALSIAEADLTRLALADTATSRVVTLVERLPSGALREAHLYLFPALSEEVVHALEVGGERAGLVRVRADSESARCGLPGYADRTKSVRFLPASELGSLRLSGLVTVVCAIAIGILSAGMFVPIGTGYLLTPYKRRFFVGWAISAYLTLCVVASGGLGWPATVAYASLLNVLALRDLTRNALKARVDGFVDRRAFLPAVASRVWVPKTAVLEPGDRYTEGASEPLTDGTWRAVVRLLAEPVAEPSAYSRAAGQ